MSLEHLEPFAGHHAIQSVALAIEFSAELDVNEVARLRASYAELKSDFPNLTDQHRTTVSFSMDAGQAAPPPALDIGGFVLERRNGSALPGTAPALRAINVSREGVVIAINDYTRWDKFKTDTDRYLSTLLKSINAQKGLSSVGLQISDAFIWRADPADLDLKEVFVAETPYLVPHVLSPELLLWHSHHGYLMEVEEPTRYQDLNNVNVSRNIVSGLPQLQIVTSHKATFQRPLYKFLDANKEKISEILARMHAKNKEFLGDLLTPELQGKINLNKPKD